MTALNTFYRADAALALTPFPFTELMCGYKIISYDCEKDNLILDSTMSGSYIGVEIRF